MLEVLDEHQNDKIYFNFKTFDRNQIDWNTCSQINLNFSKLWTYATDFSFFPSTAKGEMFKEIYALNSKQASSYKQLLKVKEKIQTVILFHWFGKKGTFLIWENHWNKFTLHFFVP